MAIELNGRVRALSSTSSIDGVSGVTVCGEHWLWCQLAGTTCCQSLPFRHMALEAETCHVSQCSKTSIAR